MYQILSNYLKPILLGLICGLSFAPVFFVPGILTLSVLCHHVQIQNNIKSAFKYGYLFGLGFFFATLYWIAFALWVYIDMFGWLIPFALFVPSLIMAIIIGSVAAISWCCRQKYYYHFIFCCIWVFFEWVSSWIFTGLPWSLLGYTLSFSTTLIQSASIFGIFGLSFVTIYVGSCLYSIRQSQIYKWIPILISFVMIVAMIIFGLCRLHQNPTQYTDIKIRVVQPSIPQTSKWDAIDFWYNLEHQIELSNQSGDPDIIIWSEAALTVPFDHPEVLLILKKVFHNERQILISGGVMDNNQEGDDYKIYSSLIAFNNQSDNNDNVLFAYHKSHLVPFGEYIPFHNILPLQKITHGLQDYTKGQSNAIVDLKSYNLKIRPLICYESIFPLEVIESNAKADLFINVTNDAWYGNSSGPYQHFEISRMRAIESGIPMVRAGNNGISAIIDPVGRVIQKLPLDKIGVIDSQLPHKLNKTTLFTDFIINSLLLFISTVYLMQLICIYFIKKSTFNLKIS